MLKAAKVRIYPTPEQAELLNRQFGAVRFAYNKALHIISSQYKRHYVLANDFYRCAAAAGYKIR